jgi:hypothetical protein
VLGGVVVGCAAVVVGAVVVGAAVVAGATVEAALERVVADSSPPPPLHAGASKIAAVKRNRVVRLMTQIYQVRGGVRSRSEGA